VYPFSGKRASCTQLLSRTIALGFSIWCAALTVHGQQSRDVPEAKKNADAEKIYEPGGDVKRPKLVHYVEPEFSPKSKEAFVEGTVKISTVVTLDGLATSCRVLSGLNAEEDRTALEALKQWKFQPGSKSGQPVNVRVTVEIDFHLL
jgi:TonB family protein